MQVFVRMLGVCACQATDRDLERVSAVKKINAWICASVTTDRDLASAIPDEKIKICIADLMFFELPGTATFVCNSVLLTKWFLT